MDLELDHQTQSIMIVVRKLFFLRHLCYHHFSVFFHAIQILNLVLSFSDYFCDPPVTELNYLSYFNDIWKVDESSINIRSMFCN